MDPVQFLKCISFFSLDRIIIYWNRLYDLQSLVGLPVWFCWTNWRKQLKGSNACLRTSAATEERSVSGQNLKTNLSYGSKSRGSLATSWPATWSVSRHLRWLMNWTSPASNNWCTRFLAHHNLALHLSGCHSCHTRRENSHNQYYWPWEVLLHSRPFLPGWWKKLKPMVIFKWKTQPKEKFPPGVVVHHHPKGWMDADGMKLWIQKVWSLWPGGLLKKKKACLSGTRFETTLQTQWNKCSAKPTQMWQGYLADWPVYYSH